MRIPIAAVVSAFIGAACASSSLLTVAGAQEKPAAHLRPVDEGAGDPEFSAFRERLLDALKKRDVDGVMALLDGDLRSYKGRDALREELLSRSAESLVWNTLVDVLTHGGAFTTTRGVVRGRREFCAPYTFAAFPTVLAPHLTDSTEPPWVVIGDRVAVRSRPNADAPIIATLSYDLVEAVGKLQDAWVWIKLPNKRDGYVKDVDIRDPQGDFACFARFGNQWRLVALDSGVLPG